MEYDQAQPAAPEVTVESTAALEEVIKQRVRDELWDDVERKVPEDMLNKKQQELPEVSLVRDWHSTRSRSTLALWPPLRSAPADCTIRRVAMHHKRRASWVWVRSTPRSISSKRRRVTSPTRSKACG